jgi:NADH-quinone oxidoreductase subunit H
LSPVLLEFLLALLKVVVITNVLLVLFSFMTYAERRLLAFMQFRLGPNRVGPWGLFQPVADGIKLFFKEELMPASANAWAFFAAPVVAVTAAFMAIATVPYGPEFTIPLTGVKVTPQIADLDIGLLFIFAVTSLGVYSIVLAGWSANGKYSLLGGLRSSAQMFSYELSLGMSFVGIIMLAGSFRISDIVASQEGWFWNWNLSPTKQFLAGVVYFISASAEVSRTPFDLPEGETELVAGYHTEYSSMKFAMMQMAEYLNIITVSVLTTNLFLGGWNPGLPFLPTSGLWGLAYFAVKVFAVLFMFIWMRGTLPRFRYDQLMHFGWKVLIPLAALNILGTATLVAVFKW